MFIEEVQLNTLKEFEARSNREEVKKRVRVSMSIQSFKTVT